MKRLIFKWILLIILSSFTLLRAENNLPDTIWHKKLDISDDLSYGKFSNNDSIIAYLSYSTGFPDYAYHFIDTYSANHLGTVKHINNIIFFDNDRKFISFGYNNDILVIFETKNYTPIDTIFTNNYIIKSITISFDEKYILGVSERRLILLELQTGKILKTIYFQKETGEIELKLSNPAFLEDNSTAILTVYKKYKIDNKEIKRKYYPVYNLLTLDSVDSWEFPDKKWTWGYVSNTRKYFAFINYDINYGLEVYNLKTKEFIQKFPINFFALWRLEFSFDDRYIITYGYDVIIWDVISGDYIKYYTLYRGKNTISHNGLMFFSTSEKDLLLWRTNLYTDIDKRNIKRGNLQISPNPATDYIEITIDNHILQGMVGNTLGKDRPPKDAVKVYDVLGVCVATHPLAPSREGVAIRLDVSGLAAGVYFVRVGDKIYKFVKM